MRFYLFYRYLQEVVRYVQKNNYDVSLDYIGFIFDDSEMYLNSHQLKRDTRTNDTWTCKCDLSVHDSGLHDKSICKVGISVKASKFTSADIIAPCRKSAAYQSDKVMVGSNGLGDILPEVKVC